MAQLADDTAHQAARTGAFRALRELQQIEQQQDAVVVALGLVPGGEKQAIQACRRQPRETRVREAVAWVGLQQMQGVVECRLRHAVPHGLHVAYVVRLALGMGITIHRCHRSLPVSVGSVARLSVSWPARCRATL
ncbi:MAG: hypothetical protein C0521_04940 [Xanthomonas sp.]|nr:hypothetical protein [Xanthomonas sp.]